MRIAVSGTTRSSDYASTHLGIEMYASGRLEDHVNDDLIHGGHALVCFRERLAGFDSKRDRVSDAVDARRGAPPRSRERGVRCRSRWRG
jgi:hypothetical protein